jgi:hypothetical protein
MLKRVFFDALEVLALGAFLGSIFILCLSI